MGIWFTLLLHRTYLLLYLVRLSYPVTLLFALVGLWEVLPFPCRPIDKNDHSRPKRIKAAFCGAVQVFKLYLIIRIQPAKSSLASRKRYLSPTRTETIWYTGFELPRAQKNFIDVLDVGEGIQYPDYVAQYLSNTGFISLIFPRKQTWFSEHHW